MSRPFSIYLDLVRFIAACLVYLYHSNQRWLVEPILPASPYGHSAVIVFFVLSGYVIAYISVTKENDWRSYAASRLSRVYSVAIPALVLTLVLDTIGRQLVPSAYGYPYDWFGVRSLASLLMLNEVWTISITTFSNLPYWSICYESWYYVAFGLAMFMRPSRSWPWLLLLGLVLGPKVVLLAPIWLLGVALYRSRRLAQISAPTAWLLIAASTLGIVMFHHVNLPRYFAEWAEAGLGKERYVQLAMSRWFLTDYLLGAFVMLHLAGVRRVASTLAPPLLAIERPVKLLASYTFTLYLLHQPLFLFWGAVLRGDPKGYANWFAVSALVALSVVAVGAVTETRRHGLTRWIRQRLDTLGKPGRYAQV